MNGSIKQIMVAAASAMLVYAGVSETFRFLNLFGTNDLETALIRVVIPLAVAIAVIYFVFGLVIKVKKVNKTQN